MQKTIQIKVRSLDLFLSGVALENLGKYDEAIIMYDHALKLNPNDAGTYCNKGKNIRFIYPQELHYNI